MVLDGIGYTRIADRLGAPNRHCVAGVVSRLREIGQLPPAPSKQKTGAAGGTVSRIKAINRRPQNDFLHAGNIANKAESRKSDPEFKVNRAFAFDPLPGVEPIAFSDNHGCRWPVDGTLGPGLLVCGAPKDLGQSYCEFHHRLSYVPRSPRSIAAQAAERLS
jgi:hypothetical protein